MHNKKFKIIYPFEYSTIMYNTRIDQKKSILQYGHLETFSLLWLKGKTNDNEKIQNSERKLRAIINHLEVFDNIEQCQKSIQTISKEDRFVIIVNQQFSHELVPIIHPLYQVSAIYIYCSDKNEQQQQQQQWSKDFSKVGFFSVIIILSVLSLYRLEQ